MNWPIVGRPHTDEEFLNFPARHLHYDIRFLTTLHLQFWWRRRVKDMTPVQRAQVFVINITSWTRLPFAVKRMKCQRLGADNPDRDALPTFTTLRLAFSGRQCMRGKRGWICPHKNVALGSQPMDADGYITCPLHGLRIHAETGICEPQGES